MPFPSRDNHHARRGLEQDSGSDQPTFHDGGWISAGVSLEVFDYDGDGDPEAITRAWAVGTEYHRPEESSVALFRYDHGRVVPVATGFDAVGVADVDCDGRPDLLGRGPLRVEPDEGDALFEPPFFVAHSLEDGRFSTVDDQTTVMLRSACPAPPLCAVVTGAGGALDVTRTAKAVCCARLYGMPSRDAKAALGELGDQSPDWLHRLADVELPVRLDPK